MFGSPTCGSPHGQYFTYIGLLLSRWKKRLEVWKYQDRRRYPTQFLGISWERQIPRLKPSQPHSKDGRVRCLSTYPYSNTQRGFWMVFGPLVRLASTVYARPHHITDSIFASRLVVDQLISPIVNETELCYLIMTYNSAHAFIFVCRHTRLA